MALEIFKAAAMARDLKQRLELALSADGVEVVAGQDSQNWPTLLIKEGDAATDDRMALVIRVDGNAGRVDGIGLPQAGYSPHRVDMVIAEDDSALVGANEALRRRVTVEAAKLGSELEIRETAADIVDASDLEAAAYALLTPVQSIKSSEIHPLTKQM